MPSKQTPPAPSAPRYHLVILTDGEAALLAAHRGAAGHQPAAPSVADCHAFIDQLSALLVEAMTETMIHQSAIRARLVLVDRMVKLQETA